MCRKRRVRGVVTRAGVSGVAMQRSSSEFPAASQALTPGPRGVAADDPRKAVRLGGRLDVTLRTLCMSCKASRER